MTTRTQRKVHRRRAAHLGARLDPPDRARSSGRWAGCAATRCSRSSRRSRSLAVRTWGAPAGRLRPSPGWWRCCWCGGGRTRPRSTGGPPPASARPGGAGRSTAAGAGPGCSTSASSPATTAAPATTLCPRVLRVRSVTPSIDTLAVRMVRGQDLQSWTDHTPALADALHAERVAVSRRRPGVLTRDRGAAEPVPARPRRHPHPRHRRRGRPVPARRRGQRVRRPVPAQPARQAPARGRRLRRGQVVACCGTRCARPGR